MIKIRNTTIRNLSAGRQVREFVVSSATLCN